MLLFADPCGAFYSTTAQAVEGLWTSLTATIATSGLPAGNIEPTALKNVGNVAGVITVPTTSGPYYAGFRVVLTPTLSSQILCQFQNLSQLEQISFYVLANGTIEAARGLTILGISSGATLSQNVWAFVEVSGTISSTVGTINVQINGVSVLSLTNQNTQKQTDANVGFIAIGCNLANYFQDVYVADSTGSHNTSFLGDVQMPVYNAAGPGTTGINQYTPNGAGTVWQSVAAATPTDSTIFASDATPGDRMSVTVGTTAIPGKIVAVNHVSRVQKTAVGTRTASQTITSNGVDSIGPAQALLGTTYKYYTQIQETDPKTSAPWTVAGFNQLQIGLVTVS